MNAREELFMGNMKSMDALGEALRAHDAAREKRFRTCLARATLKGINLDEFPVPGGGTVFIATQGYWDKTMGTLDEVEAWLKRVGA